MLKKTLSFIFPLVTLSSCSSPPPAKVKAHIVKDIVSSAAEDSLCPQVTPSLLRAVAKVESGTKPNLARFEKSHMTQISGDYKSLFYAFENAVSHGETQILGRTARAYGVEPEELRNDPETSYRLTALILAKDICGKFNGNLTNGIAAYNAGSNWHSKSLSVKKQALSYAAKVMQAMKS